MQMMLRAADIGHATLPFTVHAHWVGLLEAELFNQGDQEAALGMLKHPTVYRQLPFTPCLTSITPDTCVPCR